MSLDIRYLTNGEKNVYVVVDAAVRTVNYYNSREEIPAQIRHYAPDGNPRFVGPDDARMFLAMNALYPDLVHEYCSEPRYIVFSNRAFWKIGKRANIVTRKIHERFHHQHGVEIPSEFG